MMEQIKHAYLILAHHEFDILGRLLIALDHEQNDIFIHVDRKVGTLPQLATRFAHLYVLEERIDVRWGDVSVIEAELLLFEEAQKRGPYGHYHLLSGVDMPLRSQAEIHTFFNNHAGKLFIGFSAGDQSEQITRKVRRYHLFPRHFRTVSGTTGSIRRVIRFLGLRLQFLFAVYRHRAINFKKGTQWVSVTEPFVSYVLTQKKHILAQYKMTFCADGIVLQTLCWNSSFRADIYDVALEGTGSQRLIRWKDNVLHDWGNDDFDELISANYMFARKFNSSQIEIVDRLLASIVPAKTNNELAHGE